MARMTHVIACPEGYDGPAIEVGWFAPDEMDEAWEIATERVGHDDFAMYVLAPPGDKSVEHLPTLEVEE